MINDKDEAKMKPKCNVDHSVLSLSYGKKVIKVGRRSKKGVEEEEKRRDEERMKKKKCHCRNAKSSQVQQPKLSTLKNLKM